MTVIDAGIHLTEHRPQRQVVAQEPCGNLSSIFVAAQLASSSSVSCHSRHSSSLKLRGAASTDTVVGSLRSGASAASERDLRCAAADFFGQFRHFFAAIRRIAGSAVASRGVVLTVAGTPPVGIRLAQRELRPPIQPSAQFLEAKYSRTSLVFVSGWGSCRNPCSWRKATSLLVVSAACGSATLVDTSSVGV